MKGNPGRKERRRQMHSERVRNGDLNRKKTHKMRTHDGMCHGIDAKKTVRQVYGKMLGIPKEERK